MITKAKSKKLLAVGTHNRLTSLLHICYNVDSPRKRKNAYEKLQKYLSTIFSYEELCEYHTDHLEELAEIIQGLYPERDNLQDYSHHILEYLNKRLRKYKQTKERYILELSINRRKLDSHSDEYLNLKYLAWTYSHGYYAQQAHMHRLLHTYLTGLLELQPINK